MASSSILLQNGIALIHDEMNHVVPTKTNILIENGKIAKIASDIPPPEGTKIIDCTDKIISPGFIDTHHHGWQTQLKGRHANEQLMEYMVTGNAQSFHYTPEDVFYGQLSGMLEGIAAGTTTVVDHAHVTRSPDHAKLAISAIASSGIRSVYCYAPIMLIKQFNPLQYHPNPLEDWVMQTFDELADQGPFGSGRVTLGFAFDFFFLPDEMIKSIFGRVTAKGIKTITCHGSMLSRSTGQALSDLGLLDDRIIISHGGTIKTAEAQLIKDAGAFVSSTPSTELQMAMGRSYCFDSAFLDKGVSGDSIGLQYNTSFGVDCHSCTGGSIVSEAKLGLQNARNHFNEFHVKRDKVPRTLPQDLSVEAAFNLATIKGAEAVNMSQDIGRIAEGYKADLAIFDALTPSMLGAAQHDPIAAIILHSNPGDIDTVIVDGIVRKEGGKLLAVEVEQEAQQRIGKDSLDWSGIAKEVLQSRAKMQKEMDQIDYAEAYKSLCQIMHVSEERFVDV